MKTKLRQPRLAEMVAEGLRRRILSGELLDGAQLPKQDDLLADFGVSPPSLREALRILETEGLITVKRGNVGGAVVHRPKADRAAYMLSLVLESRGVPLRDVEQAIRLLEPPCAAVCAARADRETTVLPRLRKVLDDAIAAIDDPQAYMVLARRFHVELVDASGNETMRLVIGAMEALWSAQVAARVHGAAQYGAFVEKSVRLATAAEHERLYQLIAEGDEEGAERLARGHYSSSEERVEWRHGFDLDAVVESGLLGGGSGI